MKKYFISCALVLKGFSSYGQTSDYDINAAIPTDNSAHKASGGSAGNSGIYNVNLYDGTASVSIPIYDYAIDGLTLGLSLNYDTRGIHVDQVASSCGLGWNLSAGGSIERTTLGVEDDQIFPPLGPSNPLNNPNNYLNYPPQRGSLVNGYDYNHVQNYNIDKEYDLYEAHFAGRSVKFHLADLQYPNVSKSRYLNTYPKGEISIELALFQTTANVNSTTQLTYERANMYGIAHNDLDPGGVFYHNSAHPSVSNGFIITDEKGNKFYFERGDYTKRYYMIPGVTDGDPSKKDPTQGLYYDFTVTI